MRILNQLKLPAVIAVTMGLWLYCHNGSAACLTNPMMQGQDPAVTLKDGLYYLVQSDGCSIHLRRSATLSSLPAVSEPVIYSPGCSAVWAPELHWITNKWYLYYSRDPGTGHRGYVAESASVNPYGPYTDRGILFNTFWNIDGSVFTATNGQLYYICSGSEGTTQNLYIAPMSNPYTLSAPLALLSEPTEPWERIGDPKVNEGPWAFQRNGRLFIVYSASGCWTDDYTLGLLEFTGTDILDRNSWTKTGPVFTKQPGAYGPGHNSVVTDSAGQWWNVYHANNNPGEGCGGLRKIRAQRIAWSANGFPDFGIPVPIGSMVTEDSDFLVARFRLDETDGLTAASTVCSRTGTLQGAPIWLDPGLKFNGSTDSVDCGAALGNDVQHALTLAAWIRADAFVDWAGVISKGINVSPYAMQVWSDGSLRFTANWGSPAGGRGGGSWNSVTKLAPGRWTHVAITYDGNRLHFYINGVLDSFQPALALRFGVVNESLVIGADFPGDDEYFNGAIRDARLYGRALSRAELQALVLPELGVVQPPFSPNEVTVASATPQQFGAVGDGVTDDSAAFQNAMDVVSAAGGGVVFVQSGAYAFYTNLNIPAGVTLRGDWTDWTRTNSGAVGTLLTVYGGAGQTHGAPFIFLNGSTALKGVNIWYPNQNPDAIVEYPFTIGLYGDCVVQDVVLVNSYQGIQVAPPTSGAKHILSTVIGSPLYKGIELDGIADISHAEDIRFSPGVWSASLLPGAPAAGGSHAAWMRSNGTAMRLLRVDGEACMDLAFSGYQVGIEANRSTNGVPGATFYSGSISNCGIALLAEAMAGQSGLQFTRFALDGDVAVTRTSNETATVQFHSCQLTGRDGTAVRLTGGWESWMQFQNCTVSGTVNVDGGVVNVVDSSLQVTSGSNHCIVNAGATRAAFVGCAFSPDRSIANAGDPAKVIIDDRRPLSRPVPEIRWEDLRKDILSRKPAKTDLYVVTRAPWKAQADGLEDDTAAIQSALDAAGSSGGGIVYLPGGKYRLTDTLTVPGGVELRGPYELRHRTWPGPDGRARGSVLQPYAGHGTTQGPPAIVLEANSGLVGVTLSYEAQGTNATPYPPAIQGRGENVYVIGVVSPNPYQYVDLDTYTCTNHLLYMVDGWALKTGYQVGTGSSGSIIDCHGNWTYWWDNYDSQSVLLPTLRDPIRDFAEHNLDMYVLGDCTERLIKNFVIPAHTLMRCVSQNGRGPSVTAITLMGDGCTEGVRLEADAPSEVNGVNSTLAIFAEAPDLDPNTVGVISTADFAGAARFFNTTLFGGPKEDVVVGGGEVGFELLHMLDHSAVGCCVEGGVFHLINNAAYITYRGTNLFPVFDVVFGPDAGTTGKVSEIVGCYAYPGVSVSNANTANPVLAWANYPLANLSAYPPYEIAPPLLEWSPGSNADHLIFSWPGDIGRFNLYSAAHLAPPIAWQAEGDPPLYSTNRWTVTVPNGLDDSRLYRLQQR